MKILIISLLAVISVHYSAAKIWGFCELARELHFKRGFTRAELPDWMCLIQHESNFDSRAVGRLNTDGSADWGLFQINDRYWCTPGVKGKGCNLNCYSMLSFKASVSVYIN